MCQGRSIPINSLYWGINSLIPPLMTGIQKFHGYINHLRTPGNRDENLRYWTFPTGSGSKHHSAAGITFFYHVMSLVVWFFWKRHNSKIRLGVVLFCILIFVGCFVQVLSCFVWDLKCSEILESSLFHVSILDGSSERETKKVAIAKKRSNCIWKGFHNP